MDRYPLEHDDTRFTDRDHLNDSLPLPPGVEHASLREWARADSMVRRGQIDLPL